MNSFLYTVLLLNWRWSKMSFSDLLFSKVNEHEKQYAPKLKIVKKEGKWELVEVD